MKCIILGDIHLGKASALSKATLGSNLNSRISDQSNVLEWVLEKAIENNIHSIIITGDVFEEPKPPVNLITMFISWLKKCEASMVEVHIIIGNHDILRSGNVYVSPLDIILEMQLEHVYIYKDIKTINIGNTGFTFMPFRDRKSFFSNSNSEAIDFLKQSLVYESSSIPLFYKKVVIGHLAIEGSIPIGDEFDDISNELFCPLSMFSDYDYVWMGHVHSPQVLNKSAPYISHIGSMDISNFGESDQKKHIVIYDCDTGEFYNKTIPTRNLKKISISVPKDTVDTTQYVIDKINSIKNIDKAIVKVDVQLDSPELTSINKSLIEKHLINIGVFNVSSMSESKKINIIKKDQDNSISTKMDFSAAVKKYSDLYIDKDLQSEFIKLAISFNVEN